MKNIMLSGAFHGLRKSRAVCIACTLLAAAAACTIMAYHSYAAEMEALPEHRPFMTGETPSGSDEVLYAVSPRVSLEQMQEPTDRSFPVKVEADGQTISLSAIWGDSVEDVLKNAGIVLGEEDQLSHIAYSPVGPGEVITVERWVRDIHTVQEEIPFGAEQIATSLLSPGKVQTVSEGIHGIRESTYSRLFIDGKLVEQTLEAENVLSEPVSSKVLVGTPGVPVSPFNFEWEMDKNGIPISYVGLMQEQRAAGYSARAGAGTASGRKAMVGHVAVNPNEIPYGSKLYITSADGSFVYGYAIAADTGTGLMQDIIDIDLFYGTYQESLLNAIRTVDIYILESPG